MHDFVTIITKVGLIVQTVPLCILVTAPCAHVHFTVGSVWVNCDLRLNFMQKLGALVIINHVFMLVEAFRVRVVGQINRIVAIGKPGQLFEGSFVYVRPTNNHLEEEESVLLAFLQLLCVVDY